MRRMNVSLEKSATGPATLYIGRVSYYASFRIHIAHPPRFFVQVFISGWLDRITAVLIPRSVKFVPMGREAGVKLQATLRENAFSDRGNSRTVEKEVNCHCVRNKRVC